ncbi:MAG: ribosome recycling factor [bacterium]
MQDFFLKKIEDKMKGSVEGLHKEFSNIRTGRASTAILNNIKVDYYGTLTPLVQIASLSVPDSRLIVIQPWDVSAIGAIEKAILKADIGISPSNDGKAIRLPIPALNEERRRELVKQAKKIVEESKISLRNIRREANEELKRMEKNKELTEDEHHKLTDKIQKLTDSYTNKLDEVYKGKEEDILEV